MAAYPPGPSRLFQLPDLAGGQAPGDLAYLVDVSLGTNAGDPSDVKSTLNDLFAEITKNITDLTVQFGNGVTGTVSAAGKGKLRYNDTAKSFQVSEDAGAYQNLLKGSGTATRVAFWSAADELSSDAALYWDNTNKRLSVGVGTSPGAPIDVLAESVSSIAQQWRPNSGAMRAVIKLDGGPETFFGTSTAHNLHLITNDLQRLSIENTSGNVGINKATGIAAQLQVVANATTTIPLILNSAPLTSVNLAELYNDSDLRFTFDNSGILTLGAAGTPGATGQLTFAVAGQANTQTLRGGATPAATNTFLWPDADPTAGQVLTASAPVAGVVTLSWGAAGSISGSGVATRVAFWSGTSTLSSDAAYYWDNTNKRLSVGVGTSPGAPIDVLAESVSSIAQQWRPNSGAMRAVIKLDGGPETFFGTSTAHNLHLITNSLQRLSIEDTSGNVGINKPTGIAAQLQVVANATTTVPLILNSAPSTSVNLAELYNDAGIRFTFDNSGILTLGKAGASGATGQLTFAVNGQANTQTLRAGTSPAATNTYLWPNADPTAGQVLTASAPVAGVVTMSWDAAGSISGSGVATRVAFWSGTSTLSSDAAYYWDNTNKRLSVGVGTSPGAPIDVLAESVSAIAQQWRPNSGTMRAVIKLDGGPETFFGTSTAHNLHLITNDLQRLSIEDISGNVGINKPTGIAAQLQVVANATTTVPLILNSAPSTSVNLAEFYNDAGIRFTFDNSGILTLGKAGASGATGQLTFAVNGVAFTHTLRAGTSPVATNTYLWPNADPTAGQVLTASAPVAGVVTLSWGAAGSISGSGVATRVAFWSGTSTLSSDAAYYWDNTNKRLSVGVGTLPGAPIDVLAESVSAIAQQWRPNSGTMRAVIKLDGGPETFFGTSTAHNLHLITNSLQRLSIEDTSGNVGINKPTGIAAQLQVVANATTTIPLILNSAPSTSVNLAEFYNDAGIRFTFDNSGILTLGKAGASGATGQLTFAVNGVAFTHTLRAGTSPAATNTYLWPNADPTAGQVLTASAPAAGVVTMSWTTVSGGTTINPTDTVIPYRFNSTTFNDSPLSVASSAVTMTRTAIGSTSADGIILLNSTAAAAGAQQFSPRLRLTGQGWKTNATAASQTVDWVIENQPVQGTTAPTSNFVLSAQVNAGGYTPRLTVSSNGLTTFLPITSTSNMAIKLDGQGGAGTIYAGSYFGLFVLAPTETGTGLGARMGPTEIALPSSGSIGFSSTTTNAIGAGSDVTFQRSAAGIFRVADSTTGAGGLLIAPSTASISGSFTVLPNNAATNSLVTVARLGVNSTGIAADGFGASLSWSAETSTTNDTETGRINVFWTTATHASRTSAISWSVVNNATLAPIMRLGTPSNNVGSPFVLTIHEGTNPNVWTNGSYAAKLYLLTTTLPAVGVAAHFSATALDAPQWQMLRGRGTNASPTAVQNSDSIGNIEWWGQTSTSTNNVVAGARIRVSATENWSAGNNGCQMIFFTSNNAGTITDRMYLKETGTLRIGATSGSYDTTNLLQIGNYASFATGVTAAIYSGANSTIGMRLIGTNGQTANMLEIFRDSLTPNLLTLAASGVLSLRAGLNTGTTVAKVGGTIHEDFTPVSNSGTGETDLMTYSVPANTLGTNNDYLEVEAFGEFTTPTGNATVKMKFGATTIFNTTALAFTSGAWRLRATIVRGTGTDQLTITSFDGDTALVTVTAQVAAPTETLSGAVTLKCTGQSGASSEVTQEGFIVKWQPASN